MYKMTEQNIELQSKSDRSLFTYTLKGKAITTGLAYEAGMTWIPVACASSWAINLPSTGGTTIVAYQVCNSVDKSKLVNIIKKRIPILLKPHPFLYQ